MASALCGGKYSIQDLAEEQDFLAQEPLNAGHLQNRVRTVCFTKTVLSNSSLTHFLISSAVIYQPHRFSSNFFNKSYITS